MKWADQASGKRAGLNTEVTFSVAFIWKIVLVNQIKMKYSWKLIFYDSEES